MVNNVDIHQQAMDLVEGIKEHLSSVEDYNIMRVDIGDLLEANNWLTSEIKKSRKSPLSAEEVEDFLIKLDVNYVEHVTFHLNSLRDNIARALENISNCEDGNVE